MHEVRGALFAVCAGLCFGSLGTFSKLFYDEGGDPVDLLLFRLVGTALLLGALMAVRRRPRPSRRTLLLGLGLGLVFTGGSNVALLIAYDHAPVPLVVLLFYVFPLLATIGDALFFRQRLGLAQAIAVAIGLAGVALTVGTPSSVPLIGVILGLAAAVCLAAYILAARHLMEGTRLEPIELVTLGYAGPAVALAIIASIRGVEAPSATAWVYAGSIVVISTVMASLFFYAAVRVVGAGPASVLSTVDPLLSVVLAYIVLDEALAPTQFVGGALILICVVALTLPHLARQRVKGDLVDAVGEV